METFGKQNHASAPKFDVYVKRPRIVRMTIFGPPTPLARPRFGDGRCWDAQKQQKIVFSISLENQFKDQEPFDGPINLNLAFFIPIPSAHKIMLCGQPHLLSPDLDTLIKYVCETARGILFKHDKTIACIVARKFYSSNPRTEIIISELEGESL